MTKTIEELIYDFANRQFHKAPINTARDLMCVCSDFANEFLAQPLVSRLTAEEKERVREIYNGEREHVQFQMKQANASMNQMCRSWHNQLKEGSYAKLRLLESIFGADFFKEGE